VLQVLVYTVLVIAMSLIIVGLSQFLGRATHNKHKDMPYESGMVPTGGARLRTSVPYYLVAIFFLMFDVEIAFLYAWGIALRELGWTGFLKAFIFILVLTGGFAYIWLRGGLEWHHHSRKASARR
jgi:NADH-quinone oxidoreductase subunit A